MKFWSIALIVAVQQLLALAAPYTSSEVQAKRAQGLRLITFGNDDEAVWKTEEQKLELIREHVHFVDITEIYEIERSLPPVTNFAALAFPTPSHQSTVNPLLSQLSTSNMKSNLDKLSAFQNRYYNAQFGADSSAWILSKIQSMISGKSGLSVSQFTHTWKQPSVILKFAGTNPSAPITILGAHQDSINGGNPSSGRAPGYDDDGTGTVNLLEVARVLINANYSPSTPLEFHWYAGEEGGLLGSGAIATNYRSASKPVKAMFQLDMTGYTQPGRSEVIAVETGSAYVDASLTTFVKQVAGAYCTIPTQDSACGYGCSDHYSWKRQGFPSAFPFEAPYGLHNQAIHTTGDVESVNGFSWSHSLQFARLALGFAVELSV